MRVHSSLIVAVFAVFLSGCGIDARQKALYRVPKDPGSDALVHVQVSLGKDYIARHAAADALNVTAAWVLTPLTLGIVWVTPAARKKVSVVIDDVPHDDSIVTHAPLTWGPGEKKGNNFWFRAKPGTTYTLSAYCSGLIKGEWATGTFTVPDAKPHTLIVNWEGSEATLDLK